MDFAEGVSKKPHGGSQPFDPCPPQTHLQTTLPDIFRSNPRVSIAPKPETSLVRLKGLLVMTGRLPKKLLVMFWPRIRAAMDIDMIRFPSPMVWSTVSREKVCPERKGKGVSSSRCFQCMAGGEKRPLHKTTDLGKLHHPFRWNVLPADSLYTWGARHVLQVSRCFFQVGFGIEI